MDKTKWSNLLNNNQHSVFQTTEWADVQNGLTDDNDNVWHPLYLVNNDWSGGMVLMENQNHDAYESMFMGCYGGQIGNPVNLYELFSTGLNYMRVVDYNKTMDCDGWQKKFVSTYLIDINDYELSNGRKDDLRKSKLAGIVIEQTEDIDKFYNYYLIAMGQFPNTIDIKTKDFFERLIKTKFAKFYFAVSGCKIMAISVHLLYSGEIFNYISMAISEYRNSGAITLITKRIIEIFYIF